MDNRDPPEGPLSIAFCFFVLWPIVVSNTKWKNTATSFNINNEQYLSLIEDDELLDRFLNLPEIIPWVNNIVPRPLNFKWLEL